MRQSTRIFFASIGILGLFSCQADRFSSWQQYKGSDEGIHYSSLTEIDTSNVHLLKPAWEYHTGDADTATHSQIQCNPIIVNDVMYATSPKLRLFALQAASGREIWQFDPFDIPGKKPNLSLNSSRGVTWYEGDGIKRIYYTAGSNLFSINAETGRPDSSFGKEGRIDLHEGLGRDVTDLFVTSTSPGIVAGQLLIVGTRVNEANPAAPGHIRAYDLKSGKMAWIFHTIPQPGEKGFETWDDPEAYKYTGGANSWSGFSLDEKRNTLFACTGSASFDFYGGKRSGDNLFANCILAIDAATGKLKWHYQTIHHDVWDRDIPGAPILVQIDSAGKKKDAVAVTTKHGFVFILDRENGKPLFPVEERAVPVVADLPGEKLSPTQPFPIKPLPFVRQKFTEADINPLLPISEQEEVRERWKSYQKDDMFTPASLQGTIFLPGLDGGAEWGGPSYDPATGIMYVNANEMAWVIQAVAVPLKQESEETNLQAGKRLYELNCMQCHGNNRQGSGAGNVPSLIHVANKYAPAGFDSLLVSGRRMMPAFRHLTKVERTAIASFILDRKEMQRTAFVDTLRKKQDPSVSPYTITGYNKFLSSKGLPALSPPWGTLNAIDLNTGEYVWKQPLGQDPAFSQGEIQTGTENYGASVITAGGVLFIAATKDSKFRAFNKRNGKLLWETTLPAAGFATPAVYASKGKQYVVIACGGGKLNTKSGDSYVAFALK